MRKLKTVDSVKDYLETFKAFGEKLHLVQLRLETIKDKIEISRNTVEAVEEVPEEPVVEESAAEASKYTAAEDDEID